MAAVIFIVHLFFLVEVLSEPHCNKGKNIINNLVVTVNT